MDIDKSPKALHSDLITHLGIDQYRINNFAPNITLAKSNDEHGLLPNWMFRADMIMGVLCNKRCFDVAYIRNDDAISYLSYVEMDEAVLTLQERESYLNFPSFSDMPLSFKSLVCSLAITESLDIDHMKKEVVIKPIVGFFQMPSNGQALIFPSIQALEAHRFHDLLQAVGPLMKQERNRELGVSL